jgi:hypothetical protein
MMTLSREHRLITIDSPDEALTILTLVLLMKMMLLGGSSMPVELNRTAQVGPESQVADLQGSGPR